MTADPKDPQWFVPPNQPTLRPLAKGKGVRKGSSRASVDVLLSLEFQINGRYLSPIPDAVKDPKETP